MNNYTRSLAGKFGRSCTVGVGVLALSACVSFPGVVDEPATEPMEPIPKPQWVVGMQHNAVDLVNGEAAGYEVMEIAETGELRMRSKRKGDKGKCSWVNSPDWFSPSTSWENCGTGDWHTGTHKVTHDGGELWPLRAGAKAVYKRVPTSSVTGQVGTPETRKCEVSGPVSITLKAGDFDAMKVDCRTARSNGSKETRTWYWTAEHGEIKYRRENSSKGVISESEAVMPVASAE